MIFVFAARQLVPVFRLLLALGVSLASTSGFLCGQTVWHVDRAGGPLVHFTDLPLAVAAAQPGDSIVCYTTGPAPQGWRGYTAPTIDKPIRLIGFNTWLFPPVPGATTRVFVNGVIRVTGIAAGQICTIANILGDVDGLGGGAPQGYEVLDCAGTVVLDGIYFSNYGYANQVFRIERSARVLIQGGWGYLANSGIEVVDSRVDIQRSVFRVGTGGWVFPPPLGAPPAITTFPMLNLLRSTATLSDCILAGHPAGTGPYVVGPGQPAVLLDQSTLNIGPYATLSPGSVFTTPPGFYALNPSQCLVRRDSRSSIPNQPTYPGLQVIHEPIHATTTSFSVVADEPYTVWVDGPGSGFALLGFDQLQSTPAATPFGELWLDPLRFTPVAIVPLAAGTGEGSWNSLCPASAPVDVPFVFQSLTLAADGTLAITLPSPFTVGWEYFRIP